VPKSVATESSAEDAEGDKETAAVPPDSADGGDDKRSSIANRWNPQGGPPQLRKVPKSVDTEPSAEDAEGDKETAAAPPEENRFDSPPLRKNPSKGAQSAEGGDKRSSIANRWNRQGGPPQLRKVPKPVATEPSAEDAEADKETAEGPPEENRFESPPLRRVQSKGEPSPGLPQSADGGDKRSSIANRWNPQGGPRLRKVPKPVAAEPSAEDAKGDQEKQQQQPQPPRLRNQNVGAWQIVGIHRVRQKLVRSSERLQ
jgi:hypothetical protein